ncbi:FMN-dependent dehydrogenase [Penicillium atrosanguineum]|nr:FMN-dependent dehydrogenase [Penicillium atrosanguineum]
MAGDHLTSDPITVDQVEAIARNKLPVNVYNYYSCGSDEQTAVERNRKDYDGLLILPRVLRDVSRIDTSAQLFGHRFPFPVGIAPSAMQRLASPEGELDVAQDVMVARRQVGETAAPFWFQIYLASDLNLSVPIIKRAEAAGFEALVLTVDTPGIHLANLKHQDTQGPRKPSFNREIMDARSAKQASDLMQTAGDTANSASLTWSSTMKFLRQTTNMKIILKGVMAPEDAQLAVECGADAIVVSNHGGRQLDCVPSTIQALPGVTEVVKGKIPIIFDGGIRRGSDVFKALALGADFVLVGRPALWGLAFNGQEGVETVMNILERELSRTMALAGVAQLRDICTSFLRYAEGGRLSKI